MIFRNYPLHRSGILETSHTKNGILETPIQQTSILRRQYIYMAFLILYLYRFYNWDSHIQKWLKFDPPAYTKMAKNLTLPILKWLKFWPLYKKGQNLSSIHKIHVNFTTYTQINSTPFKIAFLPIYMKLNSIFETPNKKWHFENHVHTTSNSLKISTRYLNQYCYKI